ncbi:MAG: hypothetical protein QWI36_03200 [Wolbachia endosymbiont of Tyrophagus putrescentiae]|nr:hypothetical protein [Wolbachia endosymbiont of Tyrophagus putrescentiae]
MSKKHIFKIEKGEPFYIENDKCFKLKLASNDPDEEISLAHPYIFAYRLDNEGKNLYIASENNGKIEKYKLPFENNKNPSSAEFSGHLLSVKVIENGGEHRFALYDRAVDGSSEKFITVLPSSSLLFNGDMDVSKYKDEELHLTLKSCDIGEYGKEYLPIIKNSDGSEICELHGYSIFFWKDGTPYAFEPKDNDSDQGYYWWNKSSYGGFKYVTLDSDGNGNSKLYVSDENGTPSTHLSVSGYNQFLNTAFREVNGSFLNHLGNLILTLSNSQLEALARHLTDYQIETLVDHLTKHQLESLAHDLSDIRLKIIIPALSETQLKDFMDNLKPEQIKDVLPHMNDEQLRLVAQDLNNKQFEDILANLDSHRLSDVIHHMPYDKVKDVIEGTNDKAKIKIVLDTINTLVAKSDEESKQLKKLAEMLEKRHSGHGTEDDWGFSSTNADTQPALEYVDYGI